jgi:hypothetical protein
MRRYLSGIGCLLIAVYGVTLLGCGPSKNQLLAEQSFYAAKIAVSKQAASQPIFEMVAGDNTKPIILQNVSALRVFQLPASSGNDGLNQYIQKDYSAPWLNLLGTTIGVALPWYGAYKMVGAIADVIPKTGNTTMISNAITGDGNTQTNKTQIAGDMSITASNNAGAVSLGNPTLIQDNTSTPTVVDQPPPVIVEPSYPPATE